MKAFSQGLCVAMLMAWGTGLEAKSLEDSTLKKPVAAAVVAAPTLKKRAQVAAIELRVAELKLMDFSRLAPDEITQAKQEMKQLRDQHKQLTRSGFWPKAAVVAGVGLLLLVM